MLDWKQCCSPSLLLLLSRPVEGPGTVVLATQPVEAPGADPKVLLNGTGNAALHVDQTSTGGSGLLILPVGLTVMKISRVIWVPLLMATCGMGPQTETSPEMNQLIKNSLRRLFTGRPLEV